MKEVTIPQTTQPDEATLTLWMDGELEGDRLKACEKWAESHPELLHQRDQLAALNTRISEEIHRDIEPPYPEFFNQQILREINRNPAHEAIATEGNTQQKEPENPLWQRLVTPAVVMPAVAAAMALCFILGTQYGSRNVAAVSVAETQLVAGIPEISSLDSVYTPDGDVTAEMYHSLDQDSSVIIVLDGLEDIPDDVEMIRLNVENTPAPAQERTQPTLPQRDGRQEYVYSEPTYKSSALDPLSL